MLEIAGLLRLALVAKLRMCEADQCPRARRDPEAPRSQERRIVVQDEPELRGGPAWIVLEEGSHEARVAQEGRLVLEH
jgi:hypothetical protein